MRPFVGYRLSLALLMYGTAVLAETVPQLPLTSSQISQLHHLIRVTAPTHALASQPASDTAEHVVWDHTPIPITLPIGKERMVHFPGACQVGYDKTRLTDDVIRLQNNNGTLYFLAKKAFAEERVPVKCANGTIVLLDICAKKCAPTTPLSIVIPDVPTVVTHDTPHATDTTNDSVTPSPITPITLTRFAVQQLYAPTRLLTESEGLYRVPMHTAKTISLVLDGSFTAKPLASWRGGDYFVTAVLLKNNLPQPLTLHPHEWAGHWQTATFFPQPQLGARGEMTDRTTVFLVSNRSWSESLTG